MQHYHVEDPLDEQDDKEGVLERYCSFIRHKGSGEVVFHPEDGQHPRRGQRVAFRDKGAAIERARELGPGYIVDVGGAQTIDPFEGKAAKPVAVEETAGGETKTVTPPKTSAKKTEPAPDEKGAETPAQAKKPAPKAKPSQQQVASRQRRAAEAAKTGEGK